MLNVRKTRGGWGAVMMKTIIWGENGTVHVNQFVLNEKLQIMKAFILIKYRV